MAKDDNVIRDEVPLQTSNDLTANPTPTHSEKEVPEYEPEIEPDTGYAWIILIAGFLNFMLNFGMFQAFGVFQTYFLKTMFLHEKAEKISWIGTAATATSLTFGVFAGPIYNKIGLRYTLLGVGTLTCLGLVISGFCTEIWQLIVAQGLMTGIGASIVINVSLTVVSSWFVKKRAFALSIMSAAGGVGGGMLVPIVSASISGLGIKWAFIILGLINATTTIIGTMIMRLRSDKFKPSKKIINFKLLKDSFFIPMSLACMFMNSGQYATILYYPASVIDLGYSNSLGYYTVLIYCACVTVFRLFMSVVLDRVSPVPFTIAAQTISTLSIMALWYPSKSLVVHIIFYILFSLTSSTIYGVSTVVNAMYFKPENVGQANGLSYLFYGFGILMGNPLTGLIFDSLGHRTNYHPVMIFSASCFAVSTLFLVLAYFFFRKQKS